METKIGMIIPTWEKQCGVADYTKQLIDHTNNQLIQIKVYSDVNRDLPSLVKQESMDLVHFQYEHSIYDFNILYHVLTDLNRLKIPVVTTLHSWSSELIPQNLLISGKSSMIIVHSNELRRLCVENGYPEEKMVVMPMGSSLFPLGPKEKTKKLFNINGYPCIGFFGFPFPHKGIRNLIDAIQELKIYFPDIKGYFFSHYPNYLDQDHPYHSFLQELQSHFDQNDHLIWCKEFMPESALVNLLHRMDINVLPYVEHNQKGISAAVRLLLAAKRPVIATDYLYFSDLKDEVYKMPDAEPETIARSICQVFLDSTLQDRLISKGDLYLQQNSWDQVGNRYREFYQKYIFSEKRVRETQ